MNNKNADISVTTAQSISSRKEWCNSSISAPNIYASKGKHYGSIAKRKGICECGKKGKYGYWGKYYCKECFIKRLGKNPEDITEESGNGSSGMIGFKTELELKQALSQIYMISESYKYPYLLQEPK